MSKVAITLVDDHVVVRSGLKSLIEVLGDYTITNEYSNGEQLIKALEAGKTKPDIIIMDLEMPVMDGEATMRWMQKNRPQQKVLTLTWDADERKIIQLFRLGVRGYLIKSCTADVLQKAIDDTYKVGYYHSELLQTAMMHQSAMDEKNQDIQAKISEREKIFIELVCDKEEYTYDNIAEIMHVHRRTVDGYRESLFEKFNLRSKTGLVMFAIKHGLVQL
jgi:two-component system invasion response regulator UvrY